MARVMHAVGQPLSFQLGAESALKRLLTNLVETGQHRSQPIWRMKTIANDSSPKRLTPMGVDVLVNNAGITEVVGIEEESLELFRRVLEINTTAVWHLSKLSAPSMIDRGGGSIINVASMLGHVGATPVKQANYCASKGAVVNMTRELALQWARKGIRVNVVPRLVPFGDDRTHARRAKPRFCATKHTDSSDGRTP